MPDLTPPHAPEGFKALWQDPVTSDWVLLDKDLDVACWNEFIEEWDYQYDFDQSQVARELLRVAAERDELRAENERLNQENEALMTEVTPLREAIAHAKEVEKRKQNE